MSELARLFISIALFKKGPQDVPYSWFLLIAVIVTTFAIDLLIFQLPNTRKEPLEFFIILRYLLAVNVVSIVVVYLIFYFHNYKNRFLQSMTAMSGIDLIMSIISIPIHLLLIFASVNESVAIAILGTLLIMFQIIWNLLVYTHIFRFGLSVSLLYGGMLSLVMFAFGISLSDILIPTEAA